MQQDNNQLPGPLAEAPDVKIAQAALAKANDGLTTAIVYHMEGFFAALLRLPLVREVKFVAELRVEDGEEFADFHVIVNGVHQLNNLDYDGEDKTIEALHELLEPFERWLDDNDPYSLGLEYGAFEQFYGVNSVERDPVLSHEIFVRYGNDADGELTLLTK